MKTLKTLLATTCLVASSISLNAQTASWTYGNNVATLNPATANLGIGLTATTANKLSIQATSTTQNGLKINNSTGGTMLLSHYNGGLSIGSSVTPPAYGLYLDGKIGLNTPNPVGRIHMSTESGGVGLYLALKDNPGGSGSPMILWDSRKGGAEYFFMMRQTGNSLTIERATGTPSMWDGNMRLLSIQAQNGNVGIGTSNPYYKLDVNGALRAKEVIVNLNTGADFVFEEDYALRPLKEVSDFIIANKHLPEIPSAANMVENGLDMGEFQIKLLQKIEELTLYIIEQDKRIMELEKTAK